MHLRLSLKGDKDAQDVLVTADATTTVKDLARALDRGTSKADSVTLEILAAPQPVLMSPQEVLVRSELTSGASVRVIHASESMPKGPATFLLHGQTPAGPARFELHRGAHTIGRSSDCDVQVKDATVSRHHAQLVVGSAGADLHELGSANGTLVNGVQTQSAHLVNGDVITIGDSDLRFEGLGHAAAALSQQAQERLGRGREFIRAPRLFPVFAPQSHPAPAIPQESEPPPFPLVMVLAPVILAALLFAVNPSVQSLAFVIVMPLMAFGGWWESRRQQRKQSTKQRDRFRNELAAVEDAVRASQERETALRAVENPGADKVVDAIARQSRLLWSRRPDLPGFLQVRLGTGADISRVSIDVSGAANTDQQMRQQLLDTCDRLRVVTDVPILADLMTCANLGIAGPSAKRLPVARSVLMQVLGLHSPAEVVIVAMLGQRSAQDWDWLKWVPHCAETYSPFRSPALTLSENASSRLLTEIEDLIAARTAADTVPLPAVVILAEHDATVDVSRLISIAEHGKDAGVHVIWCAERLRLLPAACKTYVGLEEDAARVGYVQASSTVSPLHPETLNAPECLASARALAPLIDAGSVPEDISGIPRFLSLLSLMGEDLGSGAAPILDRWHSTLSLPAQIRAGTTRTLRAVIGQGAADPLAIDLRLHGPHALVAGTTGSGKSEFLQSWVLALAANYSPAALTFLFIDYKGGSAFGECVRLPHSVGLVTDLSPHLVKRALTSLEAEIRFREHLLNSARAKDLATMEEMGHPDTPPSLIIVVDEFAALARDVPEFVEGVVNIAQRGRSLGLHLVLATQRPAGVINDNIRANTNLRIALRMADIEDSVDVLGTPDAAAFDAATPGRAAVKAGASRITAFQAAYAGATTTSRSSTGEVTVQDLVVGRSKLWPRLATPGDDVTDPTASDMVRLLLAIDQARADLELPLPRRPWLDELPDILELARLVDGVRSDENLIFALADLPAEQRQTTVGFRPDIDGHLLIAGAGRAGKTTALRSLAIAAGATQRGGPVHVYAMDFAGRGLSMLESLPHVGAVISADEDDRIVRLLRQVRATIDDRAARFAACRAGTITEYRAATDVPEPRILLLLDGLTAFRNQHDTASMNNAFDLLTAIATEGRQVGVHLAVTCERLTGVPSSLGSLLPFRLLLRPGDELDVTTAGLPRAAFGDDTTPGRGYLQGTEVQVAVLGASASVATQALAVEHFAWWLAESHPGLIAPEIRTLPQRVALADVLAANSGHAYVGLDDGSLQPVALPAAGTFLVAGPPESGRTTCLETMALSVRAGRPALTRVLIAPQTSRLRASTGLWDVMLDADLVEERGDELIAAMTNDPARYLLVIEDAGSYVNEPCDYSLQAIVKSARESGQLILAEGTTETVSGSWPLLKALRFHRRGLVLQPDGLDGDLLFDTTFPRVRRADFPVGRGLWVEAGRVSKVQVAIDE